MLNQFQKVCAAGALMIASPALVSAQPIAYSTKPPIAITSFHVIETYVAGLSGGELVEAPQFIASGIALSFTNTDTAPVTAVTFIVDDGNAKERIVDKGTFSPGVAIKHTFGVDGGISADQNATCTVTDVAFADGRVWHTAGT